MNILIVEAENERTRPAPLHGLHADGHKVLFARTEDEVCAIQERRWPELILMNMSMHQPCAQDWMRKIKGISVGHRYVPIIFLAPIHDEDALARFVTSYADDFIELPHNQNSLKAKLTVMERSIQTQANLTRFKHKTEIEIGLAKHMFAALTHRAQAVVPNLNHWLWPAGHFSGDVLIYDKTPDGELHVMLADFTGHGLTAAVGALPSSDAFFAMTRKGMSVSEIVCEINAKLKLILPTGYFSSACLFSINAEGTELDIWNGGLPPVLLLDGNNRVVATVKSSKPPLGILAPEDFDGGATRLKLPERFSMVMYSDGLTDAVNPEGEIFGEQRLQLAIRDASTRPGLLEGIKQSLLTFMNGQEPLDDVSLVMLGTA
jgi:serine phosphatase RsbU (regulator of sigma subunit)